MPPPSCTGISSPTSARIALTALSLTGLPANAPLRSTRCSRRAPASTQRRAMPAGSSLKTVASFMSPWRRRTQWPSLRSIAGISSMAEANGGGRSEGRAKPKSARCPEGASGVPVQEVAVQREAVGGAFLGMELGRENIIASERRGKASAVVGFAGAAPRIGRPRAVAVHEVEPGAIGDARPERMRAHLDDLVPAHLRHLVAAAVLLEPALEAEAHDLAGDQTEARGPAD